LSVAPGDQLKQAAAVLRLSRPAEPSGHFRNYVFTADFHYGFELGVNLSGLLARSPGAFNKAEIGRLTVFSPDLATLRLLSPIRESNPLSIGVKPE
jgi:hypothetical protein